MAGKYRKLSPGDIDEIWVRLRAGHPAKHTARQLGIASSTVRAYLIRCGGIQPDPRCRSGDRLRFEEREEISRGLATGLSLRAIAVTLGRSASTVSREVAINGGRRRYRAAAADRAAWSRATRPKECKLATNTALAGIVAEKRPGDARVAREHLPHPVRAVAGSAAPRVDRPPAHRKGPTTAAWRTASRRPRRQARDCEHQRATSRGRGPCRARPLGRRPGLRQGHEPGRTLVEQMPSPTPWRQRCNDSRSSWPGR